MKFKSIGKALHNIQFGSLKIKLAVQSNKISVLISHTCT